MKYASQKQLPLYTQETSGQAIDFPKTSRQILISEQEFLQLKWEVNYWKSGSPHKTMQVWKYRHVLFCKHLIFCHVLPEPPEYAIVG